jgi:hypothetical protein
MGWDDREGEGVLIAEIAVTSHVIAEIGKQNLYQR